MDARTAQILGAVAAVLTVGTWVLVRRVGPPPCTGGVFVELTPPLTRPGFYRFELTLDDRPPCSFVVPLPADRPVDTRSCGVELALSTRTDGGRTGFVRLAIGAAPERLALRVGRGDELAIDAVVHPMYSAYPAPRAGATSKRCVAARPV